MWHGHNITQGKISAFLENINWKIIMRSDQKISIKINLFHRKSDYHCYVSGMTIISCRSYKENQGKPFVLHSGRLEVE